MRFAHDAVFPQFLDGYLHQPKKYYNDSLNTRCIVEGVEKRLKSQLTDIHVLVQLLLRWSISYCIRLWIEKLSGRYVLADSYHISRHASYGMEVKKAPLAKIMKIGSACKTGIEHFK